MTLTFVRFRRPHNVLFDYYLYYYARILINSQIFYLSRLNSNTFISVAWCAKTLQILISKIVSVEFPPPSTDPTIGTSFETTATMGIQSREFYECDRGHFMAKKNRNVIVVFRRHASTILPSKRDR